MAGGQSRPVRRAAASIGGMLPDQFHWNPGFERLKLREHTLILIEPGPLPVPLINIMRSCLPRRLFFSTHAIAIRYAETWARKWEAEIRLHVGNLEGAAMIERRALLAPEARPPPAWTSADDYRRRRGQRKLPASPPVIAGPTHAGTD